MKQGFITIATGKFYYKLLALNLARSFEYYNQSNLTLTIATDDVSFYTNKVTTNIIIKYIDANLFPSGFAIKLFMNTFSDYEETIFIDCDCLLYKDPKEMFEYFSESKQVFGVIGTNRTSGDFFGNIESIREYFQLEFLPKFVGSVYYFKKHTTVDDIFAFALSLMNNYDALGLIRLANMVNEEPLIAISLAKYNIYAIEDDGSIKADMMFYSNLRSNILYGKVILWNETKLPVPEYSTLKSANPCVVHFNSSYSEGFVYKTEIFRLKVIRTLYFRPIADLTSWIIKTSPGLLTTYGKNVLRPIYRSFIGYRKVKQSKRF